MALLQIVNVQVLPSTTEAEGQVFVAFHRRCDVAVSYSASLKQFMFYKRGTATDYNWRFLSSYSFQSLRTIVSVIPLEFWESFAIVGSNNIEAVLIIVNFEGVQKAVYTISSKYFCYLIQFL